MGWIVFALFAARGILTVVKAVSRNRSAGNLGQRYIGSMPVRKGSLSCRKCGYMLCESGRKAFTDGYLIRETMMKGI